jgi:hypothetical protein
MKIGEYHHGWQKTTYILKQDGHLLFGGQKIQESCKDKKIKVAYENFMPTLDNLWIGCGLFSLLYRYK